MPPVANPKRNGRPAVKVRRAARPQRQPVVVPPIKGWRQRVRHHVSHFVLNCGEALTVECVVLALLHLPPAAAIAFIFAR